MHSTRKLRITRLCAALALCPLPLSFCLLPRVGVAQAKESQTVEPFYFRPLTREDIGTLRNVDAKDVSEGRVAPDRHMIITGQNTQAYLPPGKHLELLPNINLPGYKMPGFKPVSVQVFEDNKGEPLYRYGLEMAGDPPLLYIDPPTGGATRKTIRVAAYDANGKVRVVMQCVVRSHVANDNVADLGYKTNKEQCSFNIKDNQTLTARHLYIGDICLGRLDDKAGNTDMDQRCLAPGTYTCQLIAKDADGILLPGPSSEFVVAPRYTIVPTNTAATVEIPEENIDAKFEVTVAHRSDVDIATTRVYMAGLKMGEVKENKDGDFKIKLPLRDVPSGKTSIEVIGVAPDGVEYPVENITVTLHNGAWSSHIKSTAEWQSIEDKQAEIRKLEADMRDWLKQAEFEPEIRKTKTVYTLKSITDHFAPGKKGEYMGKAARCLTQMAQLQFQSAQLYKKLQILIPAKNMFYTVVRELGADSVNGEKAQTELTALCKTNP